MPSPRTSATASNRPSTRRCRGRARTTTTGSAGRRPWSAASGRRRTWWASASGRRRPFDLDPARYAAHGGSFPLLVRGTGPVGTVTVSGLPQLDDHLFVVECLRRFLTER
ncbi:heme-binding protein [Streptacidiphilus monticola]